MKKAQDDRTRDLKAIVEQGAEQTVGNTGRKPISLQEMNALNPKFQDYYDEAIRRDPTFASRIRNKFLANSDEDKPIRPDDLTRQKLIWSGMQPDAKLKADPSDMFNKGLINKETRDRFESDRAKIKAGATNVFAADAIMRRHGAALNSSGIHQSATDAAANEKYLWLRGALQSELQRIQGTTGVQVKGPQEDQIINDLLKEEATGKARFLGMGTEMKPRYEIMSADKPDWVKKDYGDAVKDKSGQWLVWREGKPFFIKPPEAK
jgi:hypothetical protein